jgi:transcriptional antiterminator NusG
MITEHENAPDPTAPAQPAESAAAPTEADQDKTAPEESAPTEADPAAVVHLESSAKDETITPPGEESAAAVTSEIAADEPVTKEKTRKTKAKAEKIDQSAEPTKDEAKSGKLKWYVVKVQSGREDSIKAAIERRVKIEGVEEYFGQVVVPVERITEMRNNKRVVKKRKKFPGYVMAEVDYNDKILYLFRETAGVGDFVGAAGPNRAPIPMSDREVASMLRDQDVDKDTDIPTPVAPSKIPFSTGDRVRVRDGIFQGLEGEIKEIKEPKDASETFRIRVELIVFGRPTMVDLEHWQIDPA